MAFRQLVPPDPGEVFAAVGAGGNPKGGNTEFADMRAAYDALDDDTKAEIDDLVCEHSLIYSRGSLGFSISPTKRRRCSSRCCSALVRTHPVSAASRSICLACRHDSRLAVPEARLLLRDLTEHATQPNSSTSTNGRCTTS